MKKKSVLIRVGIAVALLVSLSCTTVKVSGDGGAIKITRDFGLLHLQVCPQAEWVAAEIKSLGAVSGIAGFSLGATWETVVAASPDCKAIFWVQNKEQVESIKHLIEGLEGICTVSINREED
jgi:hypothetical protein